MKILRPAYVDNYGGARREVDFIWLPVQESWSSQNQESLRTLYHAGFQDWLPRKTLSRKLGGERDMKNPRK